MNELLDNIPCSIGLYKDESGMKKYVINKEKFEYDLRPIRNEELEWIRKIIYNL